MKKPIYKTVFHVTVLSEEPISGASLSDIQYETEQGGWIGGAITQTETKLSGKEAVAEIYKAASDPGFFNMDDNGNVIEEEFDENKSE